MEKIRYNIEAYATFSLFQLARNNVGESRGAEIYVPENLVLSLLCGRSARVGIPNAGVLVLNRTEGSADYKARRKPCFSCT